MAIEIIHPGETKKVVPGAARAKYNHLRGTYDLYDGRGEVVGEVPARDRLEFRPAEEPRDEAAERSLLQPPGRAASARGRSARTRPVRRGRQGAGG